MIISKYSILKYAINKTDLTGITSFPMWKYFNNAKKRVKATEVLDTETDIQVRCYPCSVTSSGTCDGGLEKSSFLSFSWSWSLFCLNGAGWLAVCCDWEATGSLADIGQTDFRSLGWSGSFDLTGYEGQNHEQR